MSASFLLPCTPPPYKSYDRSPSVNRGGPSPRISRGAYSNCQGPSKTPLLKSCLLSPQPTIVSNFNERKARDGFRAPSQSVDTNITSNNCRSQVFTQRQVPVLSDALPKREAASLSGGHCTIDVSLSQEGTHSSQENNIRRLRSSFNADIPFFACRYAPAVTASPDSHLGQQHRSQPQQKPALVMPSLLSFIRSDSTPKTPLPRNSSSRSLTDPTSPSPLIRKCNTMVALSDSVSGGSQTTITKVTRDKKSRFSFLRRISSSSSPSPGILKPSPSSSHTFQWYKRNSGVWPHQGLSEGRRKSSSDPQEATGVPPAGCLRCSPSASSIVVSRRQSTVSVDGVYCKLCLTDVSSSEIYELQKCHCRFCAYCMCMYTTLKIREGEAIIECPDANCDCKGELTLKEVETLVGKELLNLHLKFKRGKEVEADPFKTWCPKPGCDSVVTLSISKYDERPRCCVCPKCATIFCASCSNTWHPGKPCNRRNTGSMEVPLNDIIKRCPSCKVPIERDAGCAQMQCKKCKHVFCWYCLASLEDDFLLRHYDKGPCKNKLGHSRASVFWHRAQVVIIFAGFGLLLVFASPLLLFIGPCLLCRSCKTCAADDSSSSSGESNDSAEFDYDSSGL